MPGAYAHLTLVNFLKEPSRLEKIPSFPTEAIRAILKRFKYVELGAVSPDYPYLAIQDKEAAAWADKMHYERTGDKIIAAIPDIANRSDAEREKGLAWLLGYAAHVGADVTIHPVVELKVGAYQLNKTAHRRCEMHQDAYIFQRMNLGGIGLSEHLDSGIAKCTESDGKSFDKTIKEIWSGMLLVAHPELFQESEPNFQKWHSRFQLMVDKIGEEGNKLWPIARHVAVDCGLTYPAQSEIDFGFIENLETPEGIMGYDDIFDRALQNVAYLWTLIAGGVVEGDENFKKKIGNWNLDTGKDENGNFVFWNPQNRVL